MQIKKQIRTELTVVTPKMAEAWLEKNTNNRNLRVDTAHRYARDMDEGRWYLSHQGIAFYEDGSLADGQHRLSAVVLYGKPVKFNVTYNVKKEAGPIIDQHAVRMMHDAIRIGGGGNWIDRDIIAIARFAMSGLGTNPHARSVGEINSYLERYAEPLRFAQSLVPQKKRYLTSASIVASYFCAVMAKEPRDKLRRFGEIMLDGEIEGSYENAAIRLREYLIQAGATAWTGGPRLDTSKKVQRAIYLFCRGQAITKLVTPEQLIYAVPE